VDIAAYNRKQRTDRNGHLAFCQSQYELIRIRFYATQVDDPPQWVLSNGGVQCAALQSPFLETSGNVLGLFRVGDGTHHTPGCRPQARSQVIGCQSSFSREDLQLRLGG
jgi:hypothetical protein